jgi:predicted amidohydrolase
MSGSYRQKRLFAGFLQFDVKYGDIMANISRVEAGLKAIAASGSNIASGIIVLPELWATDFAYDMLPKLAKEIPDILIILQNLAGKYQVSIAGSLPEFTDNSFYNTLFLVDFKGICGKYRKQRLFNPMQEDTFFTQGTGETIPILTDHGPIGTLVCYDLRFPELLRNQVGPGTDIAIVSAQWPAARIEHWRILLRARAIENQMFVFGANRCGTTGDTVFGGHSMIVAPDGSILHEAGEQEEFMGITLNLEMISEARALFKTAPKN